MESKPQWTAPVEEDTYLRKKYEALFENLDVTGNGVFDSNDVEKLEAQLINLAKLDEEGRMRFRKLSQKYYCELILGNEKEVNKVKFVERLLFMRRRNPPAMREWCIEISNLLYDAIDFNQDGTVDKAEYVAIFRVQWFDDEWLANEVFQLIDTNKDDTLQRSELQTFFLDLMMNQEADPALDVYFTYRNILIERDQRWLASVQDDAYLRKKYYALFDAYDVTADGKFNKDDIEEMANMMRGIKNLSEEQMLEYSRSSKMYFESFVLGGAKEIDREQFIDGMLNMRKHSPKYMVAWVRSMTQLLYESIDFNHDGSVDLEEYKALFRVQWFDDDWLAEEIFKVIDVNNDNVISSEEMETFFLDLLMHEEVDAALDVYFTYKQILVERDMRWTEPIKSTDYLRKKYAALFDAHDVTGDGTFDSDDIELMYSNLQKIAKLSEKQLATFRLKSGKYYRSFLLGGEASVNKDKFVEGLLFMRQRNPRAMMNWVKEMSDLIYSAIDFNLDGSVDISEYIALFRIQFIDDEWLAEEVFHLVDENKDGVISPEELQNFFLDLMMHQMPDPAMDVYFTYKSLLDELAQKWRGPVTNADYLRRKYRALFKSHDVNGDGFFDHKDAEALGERIDAQRTIGVEAKNRLKESAGRLYDSLLKIVFGDKSRVDQDQFVEGYLKLRTKYPRMMEEYVKCASDALYSSLDFNLDGSVDFTEYLVFFTTVFFNNNALARANFDIVDVNKDGLVSISEFEQQMLLLFMNDQPIPEMEEFLRSV